MTLPDSEFKQYCLALGKNCEHLLAIEQQATYIGMGFFHDILYDSSWPVPVKDLLTSVNIKRNELFKYIYAESCAIFNSVKANSKMIKVEENNLDETLSFILDVDIYKNIIDTVIGNGVPLLQNKNLHKPRNNNNLRKLQNSNKNFKGGINYIDVINQNKDKIIDTIKEHLSKLTELYNQKLVQKYSNKEIFKIVNMCCITAKYVELGFTSKTNTTCDVPFLKNYGLYWFKQLFNIEQIR